LLCFFVFFLVTYVKIKDLCSDFSAGIVLPLPTKTPLQIFQK
jgi:hypothetical protein